MSSSFTQISLVLKKELVTSLRDRSSWATMLMFALVTLSAVSLALRGAIPSPTISAALLWVILFFSSMAGVGNIFTSESASGTLLALRIYGSASAVLFGKFFYTLILLIVMSLFTVPLFIIFIGISVSETLIFIISIVLGVWGIASAGTLTAAIMMATDGKGGGLNESIQTAWCISSDCKNVDAAMRVIEALVTDPAVHAGFYNTGVEGAHYTIENGVAVATEKATNSGYSIKYKDIVPIVNEGKYMGVTVNRKLHRVWDAQSMVPYLADESGRNVLSYDDPDSVEAKGLYVKNGGLLGAMFWEYRGDTSGHDLLKSLVKALYGKDTVL